MEAIEHDLVEGYELTVEGMSALMSALMEAMRHERHERPEKTPHYHYKLLQLKEIEGNEIGLNKKKQDHEGDIIKDDYIVLTHVKF